MCLISLPTEEERREKRKKRERTVSILNLIEEKKRDIIKGEEKGSESLNVRIKSESAS
jgi:hypothetical protein